MTSFKYKNKVVTTPNLEKKLKQMKITLDDIEIIDVPKIKDEGNEPNNINLYYFLNPINKYRMCSIYDKCPNEYVKITKEEYYQ